MKAELLDVEPKDKAMMRSELKINDYVKLSGSFNKDAQGYDEGTYVGFDRIEEHLAHIRLKDGSVIRTTFDTIVNNTRSKS